jgi:hypothetical protein
MPHVITLNQIFREVILATPRQTVSQPTETSQRFPSRIVVAEF